MNELNPTEQRLADQLHRHARHVDIGDTPIASVVCRGRQRRERRRAAVGLAAVIAVSGTAVGTIQLLSQPVSRRVVPSTDPADDTTPTGTLQISQPGEELIPVNRVDSNLTWNVVEPGSTEALGSVIWDNSAVVGQSPPYLAWSTTPGKTISPNGQQDFIPTLYRSTDGIRWEPAGGESFTQPDISMRGTGSRNGRMFAFGTVAATAPIPNGGGGEVVVDVSDDQGASWRHITLPIDLRGLAASDGVQSVGFLGDMIASNQGVVAVGVPNINIDASVFGSNGGYFPRRDGAILVTYPTCGREITATTVSFGGGYSTSGTVVPPATAPADTAPAEDTTTTNIGVSGTEPADTCTADSAPQQSDLIPWTELGVDEAAIATMFAPRAFVSTDGETFVEGTFPALPDGYQMGQIDVSATDNGFVASAQLNEPMGAGPGLAKLYTSADGLAWTESDMPVGQYYIVNILGNGTIVAFGNDMTGQSVTAVSTDAVEWSKMTFSSMLDAGDGATAQLNIGQSSAGPGGITAVASINVDAALEAGGFSIEKDGVRLTVTESRFQAMVAIDIATGEELGRWDGRTPPDPNAALSWDDRGGYRVLGDDGTVRVRFTDVELGELFNKHNALQPKSVVLHSTDGINWSRDDIEPIAGFDTYGATRVQVTGTNSLVSVVDTNSRDTNGVAKTVVLVGTAKS